MVSLSKTAFAKLRKIGIQQVAVAELEALGLKVRTINSLERHLGVIWLEDLLQYTPDQLRQKVPHLGDRGLAEILDCLDRFDQIDGARKTLSKRFGVRLPQGPLSVLEQ